MTPEQLEHLRLLKKHLENLLACAAKRTPGEWCKTAKCYIQSSSVVIADCLETSDGEILANATYIASCAGNAEAGWRSTLAAIDQGVWLLEMDKKGHLSLQDQGATYQMLTDILASWPLASLKP